MNSNSNFEVKKLRANFFLKEHVLEFKNNIINQNKFHEQMYKVLRIYDEIIEDLKQEENKIEQHQSFSSIYKNKSIVYKVMIENFNYPNYQNENEKISENDFKKLEYFMDNARDCLNDSLYYGQASHASKPEWIKGH